MTDGDMADAAVNDGMSDYMGARIPFGIDAVNVFALTIVAIRHGLGIEIDELVKEAKEYQKEKWENKCPASGFDGAGCVLSNHHDGVHLDYRGVLLR